MLKNEDDEYYAQCIITSSIEDLKGKVFGADWNGLVVYLKIPPEIYPPTQD